MSLTKEFGKRKNEKKNQKNQRRNSEKGERFNNDRGHTKQPLIGILSKRYSENMQQIYRRTCMSNHTSAWVFSSKFAAYF